MHYLAPVVTDIQAQPVPTAGGTVTLVGSNFGPSTETSNNVVITYGGNPCTIVSGDHTTVACYVSAGTGGNYDVAVTVGPGVNTSPATFTDVSTISYVAPEITDITQDIPTSGGPATITGSDFGTDKTALTVEVNGSPVNVAYALGSSVVVDIPVGTGAFYGVSVTAGPTDHKQSATFATGAPLGTSYGAPMVYKITPPDEETSGGVLSITGVNFGADSNTIHVYLVGSGVCEVQENPTHEQVVCLVPPGTGAPYDLLISVGPVGNARNNTNTTAFRYDAPVVTDVAGLSVSTLGGSITFTGSNFGSSTSTVWVTFGDTNQYTCTPFAVSDHVLACDVPAGVGANFPITIVVGPADVAELRQNATGLDSTFINYIEPSISSVANDVPTAGGPLTILGQGFGSRSEDVSVIFYHAATIPNGEQGTPCAVDSVTDDQILCTVPASTGQTYYLTVTAGPSLVEAYSQNSGSTATVPFHYVRADIQSVSGSPVPTEGGSLTIHGSNFGSSKDTISVTYGSSSCAPSEAGDDYFVCDITAGSGATYDLTVKVGPAGNEWTATGTAEFGYAGNVIYFVFFPFFFFLPLPCL